MFEYLTIEGGARLQGDVVVSGSKNAALPLLLATLISEELCEIDNVPDLEDITVTLKLLRSLGAIAEFNNGKVSVQTKTLSATDAPYGLVKSMRASFWALGPLVARARYARVALPGGDAIGTRPVDIHLQGLTKLGADIRMSHGVIIASAPGGLHGAVIDLSYPSVGATHHLMMTAALVHGQTLIKGAAMEPEIVNLAGLLQSMGAVIEGAGTSTIVVNGKRELGAGKATIIGDRIEAATYLIAGAVTRGDVKVHGLSQSTFSSMLELLAQAGCSIAGGEQFVQLSASAGLRSFSFSTAPFPGVATDLQPLLMAALATAEGCGVITETVFENRFGHVAEYRRLGANIHVEGNQATVTGVRKLSAAPVEAGDIRAAAGLILMGLGADGTTELHEIHHLARGYENIVEKFFSLGAKLTRVPYQEQKELILGC